MTSDRPYRVALPTRRRGAASTDAAGTQFDPRVVEVCMRVLGAAETPRADSADATQDVSARASTATAARAGSVVPFGGSSGSAVEARAPSFGRTAPAGARTSPARATR